MTEKDSATPAVKQSADLLSNLSFTKRFHADLEEAKAALSKPDVADVTLFDGRKFRIMVGGIGDKTKRFFLSLSVANPGASPEMSNLVHLAKTYSFEVGQWQADKFRKELSDFLTAKNG